MSVNPKAYSASVKVEPSTLRGMWWVVLEMDHPHADVDPIYFDLGPYESEAEANEHAELIRQAMREVS